MPEADSVVLYPRSHDRLPQVLTRPNDSNSNSSSSHASGRSNARPFVEYITASKAPGPLLNRTSRNLVRLHPSIPYLPLPTAHHAQPDLISAGACVAPDLRIRSGLSTDSPPRVTRPTSSSSRSKRTPFKIKEMLGNRLHPHPHTHTHTSHVESRSSGREEKEDGGGKRNGKRESSRLAGEIDARTRPDLTDLPPT